MAMTYGETKETRFVFQLQSGNGYGNEFKTRTLTVPGQPTESTQTAFLAAVRNWRSDILSNENLAVFIQPSGWRDETGATEQSTENNWKTIGLEVELYTVQKTKWDDDSLQPT